LCLQLVAEEPVVFRHLVEFGVHDFLLLLEELVVVQRSLLLVLVVGEVLLVRFDVLVQPDGLVLEELQFVLQGHDVSVVLLGDLHWGL
jgi:hypothetical protein